jgi:type I restriction-modification system DNA methylase subunit
MITDNKTVLINIFKNCLNVLRDNEGLTGEKALRTLSYLLILKLLEQHFGNEIDIDNFNYDFSHIEDELIERHKNKLLFIARFSNLIKENEDNLPINMKYLWDDILSKHPITKNIFLKDKGFDIQHRSTYKNLLDKLNTLPETDNDILGNSYEEVIQDIMTGKVLGQFFTQPLIKKMMVDLINPQIKDDGTIETCCDPTMGTGGFLITYLKYIKEQSKTQNIVLDWNFIINEGIYGKELEPDTYQLAVSNMLISSGHMLSGLERGDSIRVPITRKFDNILANPPFGIKGLKYDDFTNPLKEEYLPIKTDNAVSLFIQAIIYMLRVEGKCAVVLPDGQDLFSKTNASLVAIREYLLKTCDLKEIIYLPSGIFTYTSIKTCVFYFVKKVNGSDVLNTKIKVSGKQKEMAREYKFIDEIQTKEVSFYEYDKDIKIKTFLVNVEIEKIKNNSYSLNYNEYMEQINDEYNDETMVKTLGEICSIDIGGTPLRSKNEYYKDGTHLWVSVRELNGNYIYDTKEKINDLGVKNSSVKLFKENTVLFSFKLSIGKTAIVGTPLYTNEAIAGLNSKNNEILDNKYLYHYLTINDFTKLGSGLLGNGSLNKKSLEQIKIPIPPLEKQNKIVEYLDFIYEESIKTSNKKIQELKKLNEYCLKNQQIFGENEIKELGEICKFDIGGTPSRSKNEYYENGENLWVSVKELNGGYIYDTKEKINDLGVKNSSVKLFEKETVLFSFKLSIGKTALVGNPLYTNEAIAGINSKNNDILNKYLYHYLTINDFTKLGSGLLGNGSLNKQSLKQIKIYIPSIEKQQEIIKYCDYNNILIKQLEKEIENNKILALQFISNIIKINLINNEILINEDELDLIDNDMDSEHDIQNIINYNNVNNEM